MTDQPGDEGNDDVELARGRSARQPTTGGRRPPSDWRLRSKTFTPKLINDMLYEHRDQEPLSRRQFMWRMVRHSGAAVIIIIGSLLIGMAGYHKFAQEEWIDAFVNAAMLLGGMGQVGNVDSRPGKLFSGFYSLYAGMVFLVLIATIMTPVFHRVLHRFHWDADRRRAIDGRKKLE